MTNRRGFLGLAGAGLASGILAAETQDSDLVVFNAKVYTVDSRAPKAEAFAVKSRPLRRRGEQRGNQGARRQGHPDL